MKMHCLSIKVWLPVFLMLFLCLFVRCGDRIPPGETQDFDLSDPDKRIHIIFRVADSFTYNSDFEKHLKLLVGDDYKTLDLVSLSRLMDNYIEDKLLLQAARERNVTVSWEEQKQHLAKQTNESWPESREETPDEMETQALLERLVIEKYIFEVVKDLEVVDDEVRDYYEQNKREFLRPERVAVSQILLDTEDKAVEVLEKVQGSSQEYFRQMAMDVSAGLEALRGGEMGVFEMNQLPFEMEKVIFSMKEGEISPVVESAYGFHIFRLDKKFRPELETLENVAPEIRVMILDQKIKQCVSQHLDELKKTMDWEFYPNNLSFPYQRNTHE